MSDQRYPYRFVCTHDPCVCDDALGGMYRIDAHAGEDWQDFRGVIQIMLRDGGLVPVDLDPVTQWCFAHQEEVFTEIGTANLICARHLRSPCDIAEAAVVRMENR